MIVYWLLLLITAAVSYLLGGMDTMVLASNFIFRFNLRRLGKGNDWLSNFRRVYGVKGALMLFLVEAIKDIVPIIIGGLLLGIKGHADVGRAFAGFCIIMGRLWPVYYDLRGSCAIMPMLFSAMFADSSLGIAVMLVTVAALAATRYVSLAAAVGALAMAAASALIVGNQVSIYLLVFSGLAVFIRHIPALKRIPEGKETRYSFREDLTYKFDSKF